MALEIERKFLVKKEEWKRAVIRKSTLIKQGYLSLDPERTVRIRTNNDKAFITIKGITKGISRLEFEYEIPLADANKMIETLTDVVIEKMRHYADFDGKIWEIDEFKGANEGLMVAEIELQSENEIFSKPKWVDSEVTTDKKYANSNLILRPYSSW